MQQSPRGLLPSSPQGCSTSTSQNPNMTLKRDCKAPPRTAPSPSLQTHIETVLFNNSQIPSPSVGADCSAPSTASIIHPTEEPAIVTSPAQSSRAPFDTQQSAACSLPREPRAHLTDTYQAKSSHLQKKPAGWLATTNQPGLSTTAKFSIAWNSNPLSSLMQVRLLSSYMQSERG